MSRDTGAGNQDIRGLPKGASVISIACVKLFEQVRRNSHIESNSYGFD